MIIMKDHPIKIHKKWSLCTCGLVECLVAKFFECLVANIKNGSFHIVVLKRGWSLKTCSMVCANINSLETNF